MGIFILKQCWKFCLEISVGAVPKNTEKATKARNAKKAAGKVLRDEGLGRRVSRGSDESEAGPFNHVIPKRTTCRDMCTYIEGRLPFRVNSYRAPRASSLLRRVVIASLFLRCGIHRALRKSVGSERTSACRWGRQRAGQGNGQVFETKPRVRRSEANR